MPGPRGDIGINRSGVPPGRGSLASTVTGPMVEGQCETPKRCAGEPAPHAVPRGSECPVVGTDPDADRAFRILGRPEFETLLGIGCPFADCRKT